MLPSKGYFKALNCPYFDSFFCDRPHCHFRHIRRDRPIDEILQFGESEDQSSQLQENINKFLLDIGENDLLENDLLENDLLESGLHDLHENYMHEKGQEDNRWAVHQSENMNFHYKPTPIAELKKQNIPISSALYTTAGTSHKRKMEYEVKEVKKPKVQYVPEVVTTTNQMFYASNSNLSMPQCSYGLFPPSVNNQTQVYRATKISDNVQQSTFLKEPILEKIPFLQNLEESEEEIDFDEVSSELNLLDEILKEYENKSDSNSLICNETLEINNDIECESNLGIKNNNITDVHNTEANNGIIKLCSNSSNKENKPHHSEIKIITPDNGKELTASGQNIKTSDSNKTVDFNVDGNANKPKIRERGQENSHKKSSSSQSHHKHKSSSDLKKSKSHSLSENEVTTKRRSSDSISSSSDKNVKQVSDNENTNTKIPINKSENLSSSDSKDRKREHSRKEHESSSSKSSKKDFRQKNSSEKPKKEYDHESNSKTSSKKDTEHRSSSHKSSKKEPDHKSTSVKSSKHNSENGHISDHKSTSVKSSKPNSENGYISDHKSTSVKSSKPNSENGYIPDKKKRLSSESDSVKHKSKYKHNYNKQPSESKECKTSSKHKEDAKERRENSNKSRHKDGRSSSSKEYKEKGHKENGRLENQSCPKEKKNANQTRIHNDDDDIQIISDDPESIIVLDSEEELDDVKESRCNTRRTSRNTPSPIDLMSPVFFPSDDSMKSDSDEEKNHSKRKSVPEQYNHYLAFNNTTTTNKPSTSNNDLPDHRVASRIKTRISLGPAWRPPPKKVVEVMTPAKRLMMFRNKIKDQEETTKPEAEGSSTGRVRIGCVPNVRLLLQEKQRLLKLSDKRLPKKQAMEGKVPVKVTKNAVKDEETEDLVPEIVKSSMSSESDRDVYIKSLYMKMRQFVLPGGSYKEIRTKCSEIEKEIWIKNKAERERASKADKDKLNKADKYKIEMEGYIQSFTLQIPAFTLENYRKIPCKTSVLFLPESVKRPSHSGEDAAPVRVSLYDALEKYCLTEKQLYQEGYPRNKEDGGQTITFINDEKTRSFRSNYVKTARTGYLVCANCNQYYQVDEDGLSIGNGCNYHPRRKGKVNAKTNLDKIMACCNRPIGRTCCSSVYHSAETADFQNLQGFKKTEEPTGTKPMEGWGVFAVDCEMYYSVKGIELGRVTVVNPDMRVVFDTCVRPENLITDYCTSLSGLTEDMLKNAPKSFSEVQDIMLELFNSETILIGHSLENDLKVLKLVHSKVVDTSVVYMENNKVSLKELSQKVLEEIIQAEDKSHDSSEDALACLKLMIHKINKDLETKPVQKDGNRERGTHVRQKSQTSRNPYQE